MGMHVYHEVPKHMMNGRLNFESHQITGRLFRVDAEAIVIGTSSLGVANAAYMNVWSTSYFLDWSVAEMAPIVVTPTVVETGGVTTINIPDLEWDTFPDGQTEQDVFGVLFYRDTGVTSTSPVIAADFFGTVTFESGFKFTYKQPDEGLLRIVVP